MSEPAPSPSNRTQKAAHLAALRKRIAGIETRHVKTVGDRFSFGVSELDAHFGVKGFPFGALHEVAAADHRATPAAWGFLLAVTHRIAAARCGPILWPCPRAAKAPFGIPYAPGLKAFGHDPANFLAVRCANFQESLWAMEEGLRVGANSIAAVVGLRGGRMDLVESRRLQLAAEESGAPVLLLRPYNDDRASAAVTRWRISPALSRVGEFATSNISRWNVALERARGNLEGQWVLEWDHGALCLRLSSELVDRTISAASSRAA